ncbi:MAG TPA: hypothetical protein VHU80_02935 [Polyangiaceae bacterium]|nr:hypothetical protein [Polyangiaceae bacterium]
MNADRVQCSTTEDCVKRGPEFAKTVCVASICEAQMSGPDPHEHTDAMADAGPPDPLWGCMDQPKVTSTAPGPFHVTFHLAGILDTTPIQGVTAYMCKKLDLDCTMPMAGPVTSDVMGNISFDVPANFTGYVQFAKGTDITPGIYFFNPPPAQDMDAVAVQVVTPGIVGLLTSSFRAPQADANGLTLINVADCGGKAAVGVSIVAEGIDPMADEFYSVGGLPTATATETAMEGFGGFVNVPPGPLTVKGVVNGTKRELQTISVLIRAGSITYAKLVPLGR